MGYAQHWEQKEIVGVSLITPNLCAINNGVQLGKITSGQLMVNVSSTNVGKVNLNENDLGTTQATVVIIYRTRIHRWGIQ